MSITYHVCKYTPTELLTALGGQCALLDEAPENFDLSDQVAHPNLCGFGKSVIQAALAGQVKELVLVNCCDTIRSAYDILKEFGNLDFLYLLDILHSQEGCSVQHARDQLLALAEAYGAYKGTQFDRAAFFAAFQSPPPVTGPHIAVLGAKMGSHLFSLVEETMPLPVENATCANNRRVAPPADQGDFAALMEDYARCLLGQLPCMRMTDNTARRALYNTPGLEGVVYHTLQFCDYYGFEYAGLRHQLPVPLLKIESDGTTQSREQLRTRLEAFAEGFGPQKGDPTMKKHGYFAGIDSGSATTDVVILDQDRTIVAKVILPTGAGASNGAQRALDQALQQAGLTQADLTATVTTGYGRGVIQTGDKSVTEITCHAKGAHFLHPAVRTVIDIGGQDSKVIELDEYGTVTRFEMNDRCAAGTGRFFEVLTHRLLGIEMSELSDLMKQATEPCTISSMCTIFAESEIISYLSQKVPVADIAAGTGRSIARRIISMGRAAQITYKPPIVFSGGVANNAAIADIFADLLGKPVKALSLPQSTAALGAALKAKTEYAK